MVRRLQLKRPVQERPLDAWSTIAVELLGTQTRVVQGKRWHHRVVEMGDGPPLFMYHGIGGHVETYARTLPQIARAGYHVYAVDALDHGFSSKVLGDPGNRVIRQAEAYVDLIQALGYEKAHYEGESMGADIGFEIGMRFPETVDKMILNGFSFAVDLKRKDFKQQPYKGNLMDLSRAAVVDPTRENIHKRLLWLVHDDETINDEMIELRQRLYQVPEINESLRDVFNVEGREVPPRKRYSEEEIKARWKTDTLILYGEFNPGTGPDYGEYVAELIGAQFYEVKGTGHWPQWEKPDEYTEVILSFLES
jgi:pimeloyl-ACP methyl ester carboxylesterase